MDIQSTTLRRLRNTRDLRAEMLGLAGALAGNRSHGRLIVVDPVVSKTKVRAEWERLLPAIEADVSARMALVIEQPSDSPTGRRRVATTLLPIERPNYRYEVFRLLLGAALKDDGPQPFQGLLDMIGASQTPVRAALAALKRADVAKRWGRGVEVDAQDISIERLAKIGALPQTLRFRFERGAQIKTPAALLERVLPLLGPAAPAGWEILALSGTPVAQADVPTVDILGIPRLDLVAHVPRDQQTFDTALVRLLDDGLELEPNVLAPAPLVIALVRADTVFVRDAGIAQAHCACPADVFLALLDIGLREQALHYAKAELR